MAKEIDIPISERKFFLLVVDIALNSLFSCTKIHSLTSLLGVLFFSVFCCCVFFTGFDIAVDVVVFVIAVPRVLFRQTALHSLITRTVWGGSL